MQAPKPVLIVESPAKAKTIRAFLHNNVDVLATLGHIIDLPKSKLGVDVKNNYEPTYVTIKGRNKVIQQLKTAIKQAPVVYLASDPDREGESIAWQVVKIFNLQPKQYKRIVFHEITEPAIKAALANPRDLDMNLVEAQQTRRILDRLIGYPLSQLLWKKIRYGLSAGRVQSAALRLIVEREEEREQFKTEKYYLLTAEVPPIQISIVDSSAKQYKFWVSKQSSLEKEFIDELVKPQEYSILDIETKTVINNPPAPFDTATLQQVANKHLGFSAKKTMQIAQKLYQGVDIPGIGQKGLITYMRTDSVSLSKVAIQNIRRFIKQYYGTDLLNRTARNYKTKSKVAQEAHEAIRPTYIDLTPDGLKDKLPADMLKLYTLIWKRTIATQMPAAEYKKISITFIPKSDSLQDTINKLKINIVGKAQALVNPGYLRLYDQDKTELNIPLKAGQNINLQFTKQLKETTPPARYTDATLVKKLQKLGIGRPSTYANIISILHKRQYTEYEGRYIKPTDLGILVANFLKKHFPKIVDYEFTAYIEDLLDEIANAKAHKLNVINSIYPDFNSTLQKVDEQVSKQDLVILQQTKEPCPICGKPMVLKIGKYGKFYSCPDYPECKGIKPYIDTDKYVIPKEAEQGDYILKSGPYGYFWAHKNYPNVKKVLPLLLKATCPKCGAHLIERRSKTGKRFIGCSNYPKCNFVKNV